MKTQTGAQFPRNIGYLRFVVGVVCLALAIISCGENDEDELINTDYLPIKVGNWWKYIEPNDPEEQGLILITGTTKLKDGRTAFIGETDGEDKGYLSQAAEDIVLFHDALDELQGELVYKPPLKVGATWQGSQIGVEVSAQETVNTPAGIFQNCFRVDVRVLDESDFYSVWFAKDVGPVKVAEINSADKGIEDVFVLHSFNVR